MNKLAALLIVVGAIFCSCNRISVDGDWEPIELSQSTVAFGADGGECTVTAKNYSRWWINGIQVTGTEIYYYPEEDKSCSFTSAAGDGISVNVVLDDNGKRTNAVTIAVDPSSEKHAWTVYMEAGDAFTHISVRQN